MKYNKDENFKNNIQQLYDNNIYKLSMLQIYALEEVLRYGTKEVFNQFLKIKGTCSLMQAVDQYEEFIGLLKKDINFKQYKMHQLKEFPETLSTIELFVFALINYSNKKENEEEQAVEEMEYDPYTPILYSNDNQIRETLGNLFFGEFIHQILELPGMEPIKARQKENGRIANIDKTFIIEKIQNVISKQTSMSQLKQIIDERFLKVKMNLLLGKGENAFEQYLKFNTNISFNEIFGIEKDYSSTDMDIINKKKTKK